MPSARATAASDRPGVPRGTTALSARTAAACRLVSALWVVCTALVISTAKATVASTGAIVADVRRTAVIMFSRTSTAVAPGRRASGRVSAPITGPVNAGRRRVSPAVRHMAAPRAVSTMPSAPAKAVPTEQAVPRPVVTSPVAHRRRVIGRLSTTASRITSSGFTREARREATPAPATAVATPRVQAAAGTHHRMLTSKPAGWKPASISRPVIVGARATPATAPAAAPMTPTSRASP